MFLKFHLKQAPTRQLRSFPQVWIGFVLCFVLCAVLISRVKSAVWWFSEWLSVCLNVTLLLSYGLSADCMHCYSHYTPITSEDMQHAYNAAATNWWGATARDLNIASPTAALGSVWALTIVAFGNRDMLHHTDWPRVCLQWSGEQRQGFTDQYGSLSSGIGLLIVL